MFELNVSYYFTILGFNNNVLSHLIFTSNQVGMQVKIRANEGSAKLVWAMPSVAEFGRSQHLGRLPLNIKDYLR